MAERETPKPKKKRPRRVIAAGTVKFGGAVFGAGEVIADCDERNAKKLLKEGLAFYANERRGAEPEESPNAGAE